MTSKRRKWVIAIASAAVAGLVFFTLNQRGEGPIYKGRHLSEWVEARVLFTSPPGSAYHLAGEAILESGTNSIPLLLEWLQHEDTYNRVRILLPFRRFLSPAQFESLAASPAMIRAQGAQDALTLLRTNLGPDVIVELTRLMNNSAAPQTAMRAAIVLGELGPVGAEPLAAVLREPNHPARHVAVFYLNEMQTKRHLNVPVKHLVPSLIAFASSTNNHPGPITFATSLLSNLKISPDQYVPALTNLLTDSELSVREAATNALLQIAPEVLTNAPPP